MWRDVRENWLKSGHSEKQRKEILARLQAEHRDGFGDPDLFNWLRLKRRNTFGGMLIPCRGSSS